MKLWRNQINQNAKTKIAFALCTVMAVSAATMRADDDKDKGAPSPDNATATGKASQLSRSDQNFIKDACRGGHMEVQMGKLGVQKAQSEQAKQFAQRLIDDHTRANADLKQPDPDKIAGITDDTDRSRVREKEDADRGEHKEHAELKKLENLSGTEFDRAFAKIAVNDHEKDVKEFEKVSQKADDSDVKAFAAKTLPTLREHLQQARSLQASVGGKNASNNGSLSTPSGQGTSGSRSGTSSGSGTSDSSK
jgi:putative membrane protein